MDKFQYVFSKKYLILILAVCLAFLILIIKAFDYLPETQSNNSNYTQNINLPSEEENNLQSEEQTSKEETHVLIPAKSDIEEPLEELPVEETKESQAIPSEDKTTELTPEEQAEQILINVKKLKTEKQYAKAIEELQKINNLTSNQELKATSYEEIATIYAIVKRYGTALSFAQQAFNLSPTSSREMLLARLYYKTGDMDKATRRVNNILQRDFSQDRN